METLTENVKKLPPWAWYSVAGLVVIALIVTVFKRKAPPGAVDTGGPGPGGGATVTPSSAAAGPSTFAPTTTTTTTTMDSHNISAVTSISAGGALGMAGPNASPPSLQPQGTLPQGSISGQLGVPFSSTGSGVCAGGGCGGSTSTPTKSVTVSDIQAQIARDQELWTQAHATGDPTGQRKAHADAQAYRTLGAQMGLGSLVDLAAGYQGLRLPDGTMI